MYDRGAGTGKNTWHGWLAAHPRKSIALLVLFGLFCGIAIWGGLNTGMEWTNRTEFCLSCHEMTIPYEEYKKTVHYTNRSGTTVGCPDCHVASSKTPNDYARKLTRKVVAARDVYGHLTGSVDTPEKFEAYRLEMAKREWARMKAADSRECRNCHKFETMDKDKQKKRSYRKHEEAVEDNKTCIDCHKGIAHKAVHIGADEEGGKKQQGAAEGQEAARQG
ncbi:MAG: denitrification system component NirT/cytochrome [Rhodocyclaceae bacterium]|nr:denitrification system component NirT/cytochrome [Rhodocyclaceae bacterium]